MRYFVTIDSVEHAVEIIELPGGGYDVQLITATDGAKPTETALQTELIHDGDSTTLRIDGHIFDLLIDGSPPDVEVFASGRRAAVTVESARMRAAASVRAKGGGTGAGVVSSPMPGKVVKVLVNEGDEVAAGTPLIVVEAMKMENELVAEAAGSVKKIFVQPGDAVEGGARLITLG